MTLAKHWPDFRNFSLSRASHNLRDFRFFCNFAEKVGIFSEEIPNFFVLKLWVFMRFSLAPEYYRHSEGERRKDWKPMVSAESVDCVTESHRKSTALSFNNGLYY